MLSARATRYAPAAVLAAVAWLGAAVSAGAVGPLDPADPCADATSVQCQQYRRQVYEAPPVGEADRWCGPHHGVHVPCSAGPAGFWVADPPIVYGFPIIVGYPTSQLTGCWARSLGAPTPRPSPDWLYPLRGTHADRGGPGMWFTLSCLGNSGVWPDDLTAGVALVWLQAADLPQTGTDLPVDAPVVVLPASVNPSPVPAATGDRAR